MQREIMIIVPGKILFYGQYAVLEKGFSAFSFAVLDKKKKGLVASFKYGKPRIISKQFGLDFEPKKFDVLVSFPYIFTKNYLESIGRWEKDVEIKLSNSPMFGSKTSKSGLGSSAAATVAIVKTLFKAQGLEPSDQLEIINKISQYSYIAFSKKLGSGYDIATAAYSSSIEYKRFDPTFINLEKIFDKKYFLSVLKKKWPGMQIKPFSVSNFSDILFFNILGGFTSTISNIQAIFKVKEQEPSFYFELLKKQNKAEKKAIFYLKEKNYLSVREYTHQARHYLNLLSLKAKKISPSFDEIESPKLTALIDKAEKIQGVIAGRPPGAGGKDGIAFLVEKNFSDSNKIIKIASSLGLKLKEINLHLL
ncbi:MAG: hypothetical protein N3D10_02450 [Candidatus Micrarchaeota archaeon]|nr:hypothetical protein [Candidatus Micrarchaeota archaeon]